MDRLEQFTEKEFIEKLDQAIEELASFSTIGVSENPQAVLLGGQSGAGKTMLHKVFDNVLSHNVVVINGDDYRSSHPRYYELDKAYGPEAVSRTAAWAGRMTEALIDAFSAARYNLVIEGTLRTAEVPMRTAKLLRERGYGVSLALMAVKPEMSLVSCQIRYELMRIAGTVPRATDPAHHNKIVEEIVENLRVLERSELFDEIRLYARSGDCLFPCNGEDRLASQVLENVLFGPWTLEEKAHYAHLQNKLAMLQK